MINLLPTTTKQNIIYARRNTHLRHWVLGLSLGVFGLILLIGVGYVYLRQSTNSYNSQIQATQDQLKINKLEDTQKRIEDISSSLKLVVQVLSKEVLFSKLINDIGASMPAGTSLNGLTITKVQGGIDLTASAKDYNAATQIQVNLVDLKNKLFDKADIIQISKSDNSSNPQYPYLVNIRAQFKNDSQFLFIKNGTSTGAKQ